MISERIENFLKGKSADEIKQLMTEEVEISHKGKITGLEEGIKVDAISKVNVYDPEASRRYIADATLRNKGIQETPDPIISPLEKSPLLTRTQSLNFEQQWKN